MWRAIEASDDILYPWDAKSTYIQKPPFFDGMVSEIRDITETDRQTYRQTCNTQMDRHATDRWTDMQTDRL